MANTPQVNISVKNNLTPQTDAGDFIAFVSGVTVRGKLNSPENVISSWPEFVKVYGSYLEDSDFPHICKRMLDRGTKLRVNSIKHFTDITDLSTLEATKPTLFNISYDLVIDAVMVDGDQFIINIGPDFARRFRFNATHAFTMGIIGAVLLQEVPQVLAYTFDGTTDGGTLTLVMADDSTVDASIYADTPVNVAITLTSTAALITDGVNTLFGLLPISEGIDGNNLSLQISNASNGSPEDFNLDIRHSAEPALNESYTNLRIPGTPTIEASTYLNDIALISNFLEPSYLDNSGLTGPLRPVNAIYTYGGATNGGPIVAADYVGDSAVGNGNYAFDEYDDGYVLASPEISTNAVNLAGIAYASGRKDIYHITHLSESLTTSDALIGEKDTWNLDSVYSIPVGGGLRVLNPITQLPEDISEAGDLIGTMAYTFTEEQPWFSPMGKNRGVVPNVLGVINNFGSIGKFNDLNDLAGKQINMVIVRDQKVFFQNNTNGRVTNDAYQQASVAMGILFFKKILRPILEGFLDEPADIATFQRLYNTVKPTLERWKTDRAYEDYQWNGDQGAKTSADFQINDANDVQNGKYKIQFAIKPIGALKLIDLEITLSDAGVQFN